jgi:hypothetical protein
MKLLRIWLLLTILSLALAFAQHVELVLDQWICEPQSPRDLRANHKILIVSMQIKRRFSSFPLLPLDVLPVSRSRGTALH